MGDQGMIDVVNLVFAIVALLVVGIPLAICFKAVKDNNFANRINKKLSRWVGCGLWLL